MDEQAEAAVADVRDGIAATDVPMAQLLCATQLVRIERNPGLVEAFLRRALELLGALERAGRWRDLIDAVEGYGRLGEELRSRRPDVTDVISKAMSDYCTPTRLLALATLHERDEEGRAIAQEMLKALGPSLVPGLVELMNRSAHEARARALVPLICEMAPTIAPALVAELDSCGATAARVIVKVLGHAGAGQEAVGRTARRTSGRAGRARSDARAGAHWNADRGRPRGSSDSRRRRRSSQLRQRMRSGTSRPRRRRRRCVSSCDRASSSSVIRRPRRA